MTRIKASTQEHLDIEDICKDFVVLKNGGVVAVLETTAVNFDLLSEREQDAMIEAYGGLLNSLSFPIQIVVHSKKLDINSYLEKLKNRKKETESKLTKKYTDHYLKFITELTKKNEVLDKKFYVAIPYREAAITLENPLKKVITHLYGREEEPKLSPEELIERGAPKLEPRIDHLTKQFARIGIHARRLKTNELIKLFYKIYND